MPRPPAPSSLPLLLPRPPTPPLGAVAGLQRSSLFPLPAEMIEAVDDINNTLNKLVKSSFSAAEATITQLRRLFRRYLRGVYQSRITAPLKPSAEILQTLCFS